MSIRGLHNYLVRPRHWVSLCLGIPVLSLMPACSQNSSKGDAAQASMTFVVTVTVGPVIQKAIPVEVRVIGNGEAYSTVLVKSQVDGQLEKAYFQEGQDVKEGDLLFTIDPRPFDS